MRLFGSGQTTWILVSVLAGLVLGQAPWVAENAMRLVVPALMVMLWTVFLHFPLRDTGTAFQHLRFAGWSLGINFLWTPLFAYALGWLFLQDRPDLWMGLIMLLVTPCTDWYIVFTS
jgi:arsenite transporter